MGLRAAAFGCDKLANPNRVVGFDRSIPLCLSIPETRP